jgi:hypothetical protein
LSDLRYNAGVVQSSSPKRVPFWVFSFALFPLGLGGFVLGGIDIVAGLKSQRWNAVPALVLSSELQPTVCAPAQPEIRYSYSVGSAQYVSNHIWPGKTLAYMPELSVQSSRSVLARFPQKRITTAYVNPSDPSDVVLIPGPRKAWIWMGIFAFFLSVGFWSPLAIGLLIEKKLRTRDV